MITTSQIGLQKKFPEVYVGYFGNFSQFSEFADRNYYWHQLGIGNDTGSLSWGAYAEQRINKYDYRIFNNSDYAAYLTKKYDLPMLSLIWNTAAHWNRFQEFAELNNLTLNNRIKLSKSFQTRTTLIGGLSINYKKYIHEEKIVYTDTTGLAGLDFYQVATSFGNGRGKGKGNSDQNQFGKNSYFTDTYYYDLEKPSVSQAILWLRAAQAITQSTGLALQFENYQQLSGSSRYVSGISYSYDAESEIFDDPMSYNGSLISAELTQLLPYGMTIKISPWYFSKDYNSQGIYQNEELYAEDTLRKDRYKGAAMAIRKDINAGFGDLSLEINYQYIHNDSNSYWYNYKSNFFSVGFDFQF
ncbi:MAG: hypothetical protein V2J62_03125 [candidate division KSB1 bacterium]|nr:hypothetical protein [candidate division KSB1 bacterium]